MNSLQCLYRYLNRQSYRYPSFLQFYRGLARDLRRWVRPRTHAMLSLTVSLLLVTASLPISLDQHLPLPDPSHSSARDTTAKGSNLAVDGQAHSATSPLVGADRLAVTQQVGRGATNSTNAPQHEQRPNLPLAFEPNVGQSKTPSDFFVSAGGAFISFSPSELQLTFRQAAGQMHQEQGRPTSRIADPHGLGDARAAKTVTYTTHTAGIAFLGAVSQVTIKPGTKLPGVVNYFIGNDPAQWHAQVPTYEDIDYHGLYPGIDLNYSGLDGQLKSTYAVAAGTDPSLIRWRYEGAKSVELDGQGNLNVRLADASSSASSSAPSFVEKAPVAWQMVGDNRKPVEVRYSLQHEKNELFVSFEVGAYDRTRPLVIDPTLTYSTYLGGEQFDENHGVAVDSSRNVYLAGWTDSVPYYTVDAFVKKLNASGTAIVYETYFGGGDEDYAWAGAVDASGNAYVAGYTESTDFPATSGAFQEVLKGGAGDRDVFVVKLDSTGVISYATYLGGSGLEWGAGIAVDQSGNAYVTGSTGSTSGMTYPFPTRNPIQQYNYSDRDAFVTKLNSDGSDLVYSTYLGGNSWDFAEGIALDDNGNAYIAGRTWSTADFPLSNEFQHDNNGDEDAFVTKINAAGSDWVFSTYFGGSRGDRADGIAVDALGRAYLTGRTETLTRDTHPFPLLNPLQPECGCTGDTWSSDAFVTRFTTSGTSLEYSTYLGGSEGGDDQDEGRAIAVDNRGAAYITGDTSSTNFPLASPIQSQNNSPTTDDAFVTKINPSGSRLVYSTYLGGSRFEDAYAIAVDNTGAAHVAGVTDSVDVPPYLPFPTTEDALQPDFSGDPDYSYDGYYSRISDPFSYQQDYELRGGSGCGSCNTNMPVNTATGNFWHTFTDVSIPGRSYPLEFSRTYNSEDAGRQTFLGYGWTHNYEVYLDQDADGNHYVHWGNGSIMPFGPGLSAPPRLQVTLSYSSTTGEYLLTTKQGQNRFYFQPVGSPPTDRLYQIVDRNGYTTTLSYDGAGRLQTVTDPATRSLTFAYNANNLLESVTDDNNRSVLFEYDVSASTLITATDIGGKNTVFGYDGNHRVVRVTDPNGGVLSNEYDGASRVISQTLPMTRTMQFGYTDLGDGKKQTRITDTLQLITTHEFTDNVITTVTKHPDSPQQQRAITQYYYQAGTQWPAIVTDTLGHTWKYLWDSNGNLLSSTDPLSRTTQVAYNAANDPEIITDTRGLTTTIAYDGRGNPETVTRVLTETGQLVTTTLTYDPLQPGDVLTVTNPLNKSWGYRYDQYGYPTTATNPLNEPPTQFEYNSSGWLLSMTSPRGYTATYTYTVYGEPYMVTDTLQHTTVYTYDDVGNLINVRDANGRTITNTYNLNNELTKATRPDGTHSDYYYDNAGRVISQTNGLGQPTYYTFDDVNRVITYTDALNHSWVHHYDLAGNLTSVTDANGQTTTLSYDAAYQLRNINYSDSNTPDVSFDYNPLGMRTVMTDGATYPTHYTYDSLNRLTSAQDGHNRTVGYTYDVAGRPITVTYPSGLGNVTRGYDDANRLTSVRDWLNNLTSFEYNGDGDLTTILRPNGADTLLGRDAAGQVVTMTHALTSTPFLSLEYELDPVGVLTYTGEADLSGPVADHDYDYDPLYRLTTDTRTAAGTDTSTWDYDAATQIVATTYRQGEWGIPVESTREYNAANQLMQLEEVQGYDLLRYSAFTFDANGNRTYDDNKATNEYIQYTYDGANRLTSYFKSTNSLWGGPTEYTYDGDGLRSSKGGMFLVNSYTWDAGVQAGLPLLLEELGAAYIYGPGGMLLETVQGTSETDVHYYHQDRLGSVRALTNSSGQVEASYEYDAYGNPLSSSGSVYNPFGYTGEYTDSESGIIYLRARYYDPTTQQFLTVDPALAWTEQAYAYVGGSPTNLRDLSGLVAYLTREEAEALVRKIGEAYGDGGDISLSEARVPVTQGYANAMQDDMQRRKIARPNKGIGQSGRNWIVGGILLELFFQLLQPLEAGASEIHQEMAAGYGKLAQVIERQLGACGEGISIARVGSVWRVMNPSSGVVAEVHGTKYDAPGEFDFMLAAAYDTRRVPSTGPFWLDPQGNRRTLFGCPPGMVCVGPK